MQEISMIRYIKETPAIARANVLNERALTEQLVNLYLQKQYKSIWFVACGSSFNAVTSAKYLMHKLLKVDIKIITPFTFNNYEHDFSGDDFVLCISQSGCSTNTIESLKVCRRLGKTAIGITGNPDSDFKNVSDYVINFGLGDDGEKMEFVTKGVVTIMLFCMLFAIRASERLGYISEDIVKSYKEEIMKAIDNYESVVNDFDEFFERNKIDLLSLGPTYILGSGSNYGAALEGAVKIGETVHVMCGGYELEESIHGPQNQLTPDYTFIYLDSNDMMSDHVATAFKASNAISHRNYAISNNPNITGDGVIRVPNVVDEMISPLYTVAIIQMIAYKVAFVKNTWDQHPLMKEYNSINNGKSSSYTSFKGGRMEGTL